VDVLKEFEEVEAAEIELTSFKVVRRDVKVLIISKQVSFAKLSIVGFFFMVEL